MSENVENYHCFRFVSELTAISDCSTISPSNFMGDDYTNVDAIETWAESQVKYWSDEGSIRVQSNVLVQSSVVA